VANLEIELKGWRGGKRGKIPNFDKEKLALLDLKK
jgi:hypothetical protein